MLTYKKGPLFSKSFIHHKLEREQEWLKPVKKPSESEIACKQKLSRTFQDFGRKEDLF
jgi:hypothetical protein